MEILSTGQKIKRARIYKGITLKELCKDKISISKMSCIENGKVKADDETIKYISEIIEVDYDYLIQDIYEQIINNLEKIKIGNLSEKELSEYVNINLSYAIEYQYYDLALELVHILFNYYIDNELLDKCEDVISVYYKVYEKYNSKEAIITYYLDIAKFLYLKKEYFESIVHYSRLRELKIIDEETQKEIFYNVILSEAKCYYYLEDYSKAYELLRTVINYKDIDKNEAFHFYALVCILLGYKDAEAYVIKINKTINDNQKLGHYKVRYAEAYFKVGNKTSAVKEIKDAMEIFPKGDVVSQVIFSNYCIKVLYDNKEYDKAYELIEDDLNLAISTDDIKLVERAYYLKAMILNKLERYKEAEMYLNLSLDSLYKFGSKKERRERYIDLAYLYYKLDNIKEAVKYFDLSVEIEKAM